jgi:hypothetical protein
MRKNADKDLCDGKLQIRERFPLIFLPPPLLSARLIKNTPVNPLLAAVDKTVQRSTFSDY